MMKREERVEEIEEIREEGGVDKRTRKRRARD